MKFIFCYWDEPEILNQQKHEQKIIPIGMKVLVKKKKSDDFFPGTNIIIPETAKEENTKLLLLL